MRRKSKVLQNRKSRLCLVFVVVVGLLREHETRKFKISDPGENGTLLTSTISQLHREEEEEEEEVLRECPKERER